MTSRNVLALVFLGVLAFSSVGCPDKKKDGGASAEAAGSAAPAAKDPKDGDPEDERDEEEDEDAKEEGNKKDEGGW